MDENLIERIAQIIRGFTTAREAAELFVLAGYSIEEMTRPETREAVRREYVRQRSCGERRAIATVRLGANDASGAFSFMATFADYVEGEPVGTGRTELAAIEDLLLQHEETVHGAV